MKKIIKKFFATCMVVSMMTVETLMAASTGYFNTYTTINSGISNSTYSAQQGMCIDRFNGDAYYIRRDSSGSAQLVTCKYRSKSTPIVIKSTSGASSSTIFGHGNDLSVVAEKSAAKINIYVATMNEGSCANTVLRLEVDRNNHTYRKVATYKVNDGAAVSAITYSVGNKKFILRSGGKYRIGTFSGDKFVEQASFDIDTANAIINGSKVNCSNYTRQGICFYKGVFYVPLWNAEAKKNQSVILCYKLDVNKASYPEKLTTMSNLSFRITSSKYSQFEIESVGLCDGILYFNTNCNSNQDLLGKFNDYVAAD